MKLKLSIAVLILLAILAAALYLRFGGVTHERLYDAVIGESDAIKMRIDERYQALDEKLDRIEGKLDRILEIANRPLPDNVQRVQ